MFNLISKKRTKTFGTELIFKLLN